MWAKYSKIKWMKTSKKIQDVEHGECDGIRIADRPFHFAKKCATSTSFDYYSNKLSLLLDISHKFTK